MGSWPNFRGLAVLITAVCTCISWAQEFPQIKNCLPPNIRNQASSGTMNFIPGAKVEIPCIARGGGQLTYTWLKNGQALDLTSPDLLDRAAITNGVGTLTLTAKETDEGIFQCSVTNECGTSLSHKTILRLAYTQPFPKLDKPTELRKTQGASLVLTCNPPESVPKAKITWILMDSQANINFFDIMDDNPGFTTVPLNKRVTMDYDGNLYIISVHKEDEQSGKTYVCQAENSFTRSTNRGEDKQIIVHDGPMSDMGVDLMWHSDTQTLVLEGRKARFKCIFSGQPQPTISWEKVNGNIDKARTTWDDGFEMIISEVQIEDAGEYRCTGKNQLSKEVKSQTFTLRVEAAPTWKSKPREVTVGVEESAVFECQANGIPKPTVEWFINGRPYQDIPTNPSRVLKDQTLSFTSLEKDDSQVVQCNASNVHGSIWSDVYLYVQAIAPAIEVQPPEELVVAEGQDLKVSCQVVGKPKPRIFWYRGSQPLVHDKFVMMESGDLLIKSTEKKDSGVYRCSAENKFGKASASGKVMIRDKTRIETKPISTQVDYTNTVQFTCAATTDPMESGNLRIHWLKDGVALKNSDRVTVEPGTLTISEASSQDTGNYTCVAENGLDNDTVTATLQVKAVPDPPYGIFLKECTSEKATVEWKFDTKMSNFDTMLKFIVEYSTEFYPGVWKEAVSLAYPADRATVELSPFTKYKFRVKGVNTMGMGQASEETRPICDTPMSLPNKNPDNVHTDESYTGFLVIKWNQVKQIDHNGPVFRYLIEVQEQGTQEVQRFEVNDYKVTEKRILVNNTYRPYYIKVRSENQVGKSSIDPVTITGYSGEDSPLVIPENFELDPDVNLTARSAGFRWDPVDTSPELIRGEFSGYKIRFWKTGQKETTLHEHIVHDSTGQPGRNRRASEDGKIRGLVVNLPSFADIEADVVVINKNFESNGSNTLNFSTPEGVPGRVEFLEALYRGSHHFLLQWKKPLEPNGVITGYQISYRKNDSVSKLDVGPEIIAFDDLDPNETSASLKGLEPMTEYTISIRAQTSQGLGEEFYIDVHTISDVSSIAHPVIHHVYPGEDHANITWEISADKGSRFGQVYYIEYTKKDSEKWIRFEQPVAGQNWSVVKNLEPRTEYEVRVVALTHAQGQEQPGQSYSFMTSGVGAARASFLSAGWFIGMMVAIAVLILILIIVCIIKRNRGDHYPVQEKERLRGAYSDEHQDQFQDYPKGDENDFKGSGSIDPDVEKIPLEVDADSLDYGDDDGSKFNEDGSFIGQYGRGDKDTDTNIV